MSATSNSGQHTINFPLSFTSATCIMHAPIHENFLSNVLLATVTDSVNMNRAIIDVRYIGSETPAPGTESIQWFATGY